MFLKSYKYRQKILYLHIFVTVIRTGKYVNNKNNQYPFL